MSEEVKRPVPPSVRRSRTTRRKQPQGVSRSQHALVTKERQRQALELRKAGASYRQIADQLGYNDHSAARKAVVSAWDEVIHEPAEESWQLAVERLNYLLLKVWPKVQDGNHPDHRWAISQAATLQTQLNALTGVEAPKRVDVSVEGGIIVIDGNKEEYIAALARMAGDEVPQLEPAREQLDVVDAEVVEEEGLDDENLRTWQETADDGTSYSQGVRYIPLEEE